MSKIVLDDVISGYGLSKINDNFQKIEDALNNEVFYRDNPEGETNSIEQDVDMNGFDLYNVEQINGVSLENLTDNLEDILNAVQILEPYVPEIVDLATGIREDLADSDGASLIGYGDSTVEETLDNISVAFTGTTTADFVEFVEGLSVSKKKGIISSGTIAITEHVLFENLSDIELECEPGTVFDDGGRLMVGANTNTQRIPWGIEFKNCSNIKISGGKFKTSGSGLSGSSSGFFDSTTYLQRTPVLWFVSCTEVKLHNVKQEGGPGVGFATADRDAIITALGLTPTPAEYALFAVRHAFLNFYLCNDIEVIDNEIVPDTSNRERFTFIGCQNGSIIRPKSISVGNNFASLGKVIQCTNFNIVDCKVKDTGAGSLWDIIGQNITIRDCNIDYPNGKLADISHEWGPANAPSDNILIADCTTTGLGVVYATGESTTAQITNNPITNVRIRNVKTNKGKVDWSGRVDWVRLPGVINYTVENSYVENASIGYTHSNNGGQRIELRDLVMRWTVSAGSLSTNARTFNVPVEMNFYNCDIDADATGVGVSSIAISGGAAVPCRFFGCEISDTVFATSNPAVEFIGCVMNGVTITASGSGSIRYRNCIVDGVLTSSGPTGVIQKFHRLDTNILAGAEYGGFEFVGNDASTNSSGVRASLKVIAEGNGGDVYLSYSNAPFTSTTLTERLRVHSNGSISVFNMPTSLPATSKTLWSDGGTIKITA